MLSVSPFCCVRSEAHLHQIDTSKVAASERVYKMVTQGHCPTGYEITSAEECSAAAHFLSLINSSSWAAYDSHQKGDSSHPPGCYMKDKSAKFNGGTNKGTCSSENLCLCIGAYVFTHICVRILYMRPGIVLKRKV